MDLANEVDKNYDLATNVSGCFHFVKKKLTSVPKIEIDWLTTRNHSTALYAVLVIRRLPPPAPPARPLSRPSARTLAARPIIARRSRDYRLVNTVNLNVTGWDNFSGHLHYPAIGFLVVDCLLIALPPIPGAN